MKIIVKSESSGNDTYPVLPAKEDMVAWAKGVLAASEICAYPKWKVCLQLTCRASHASVVIANKKLHR